MAIYPAEEETARNNAKRAARGSELVWDYARQNGVDFPTAARDVIADVLHALESLGLTGTSFDPDVALEMARSQFEEERSGVDA